MPRPRKDQAPITLERLPFKLRMSIVKLMADNYIDFDEALDKAAVLIDNNTKAYKKAVSKEAQSIYKSRFMKEINNARSTIQRKATKEVTDQYTEAYGEGYQQGKQDNAIYYYCKVCGKLIYVTPGSDSHQAIINCMHEKGWGHSTCHQQK